MPKNSHSIVLTAFCPDFNSKTYPFEETMQSKRLAAFRPVFNTKLALSEEEIQSKNIDCISS